MEKQCGQIVPPVMDVALLNVGTVMVLVVHYAVITQMVLSVRIAMSFKKFYENMITMKYRSNDAITIRAEELKETWDTALNEAINLIQLDIDSRPQCDTVLMKYVQDKISELKDE